jgi:geranylgeranyl diphosphate synthase type II
LNGKTIFIDKSSLDAYIVSIRFRTGLLIRFKSFESNWLYLPKQFKYIFFGGKLDSMIGTKHVSSHSLAEFIDRHKPAIEHALEDNLPLAPPEIETQFNEAVRYLIFPGGKRLRPVLTMLGAELVGGNAGNVMHAAAAVEFVHTSSLIFDDLPCMDNSAERRGRLSLHEQFGEGLSTLVGIGLLNHSYRLVTADAVNDSDRSVSAVLEIVNCVGPAGMVGGQSVDLAVQRAECRTCAARDTRHLQYLKTSSLIRLCLSLGAILTGAKERQLEQLSNFANCLGHAYQISDDIIDGDQPDCPGGNSKNGHPLSLRDDLKVTTDRAKRILTDHFEPCEARDCLVQLVDYVSNRKI